MLIENRGRIGRAGQPCHACGSPRNVPTSLVDEARALLRNPTEANVESALAILLELEEPSWVSETPKQHLALLDLALAAPTTSPSLRAKALVARGRVAWRAGRIETSEHDLEAAVELGVVLGDRVVESLAKRFLAHVRLLRGRLEEARTLATDARAIAVSLGDRQLEALAVSVLGYEARLRGEPRAARELLESAIATFMRVGDDRFESGLRVDVVFTYLDDGDLATAARYAERMLAAEAALVNRARLE
ncbi:MAG: tetratricopeptide repeat protein, partial [Myxococcales bacterium]|nr:tetratricopeptide repeat protein [Myxococcales bacterium]